MGEANGNGIKLSLGDAIKYGGFLILIGGGVATIQMQVRAVQIEQASLAADIGELRAELQIVNRKIDRYIDLLLEEKNGGSSTARRI